MLCIISSLLNICKKLLLIQLFLHNLLYCVTIEKWYFPFFQVKALRKIIIITLFDPRYVFHINKILSNSLVVFYQYTVKNGSASSYMRFKLNWCVSHLLVFNDINVVYHEIFQALSILLVKHLFLWTWCIRVIGLRWRALDIVVLPWCCVLSVMYLMEKESKSKSDGFWELLLVVIINSWNHSTLPCLRYYH